MKVYSFPRGGILFEDPAVPPKDSSVIAFLPGLSVIPLIQHTGGRAYPIVSVGDHVREGMLIGRGQGLGSANIHATVPGRVVRMVSWKLPEGQS
ncbi:MAG: 4Fe-4S ferredoxin, partial [Spirochaetaceae bacterium]|nr:4Fe-4S ferredoxin [Spirochaetaceae bacterium]